MAGGQPLPAKTLAEKLDYLFRSVRERDREEYTYREVAAAIQARGGPSISASYLWQLRTGVKDNPTKKHLEALAAFFGVPPAYFFDDVEAEKIDAQLALLAAMRDAGVRYVALRAAGLSDASMDVVRSVIERTRQLEKLGKEPPGPPTRDEAQTDPSN